MQEITVNMTMEANKRTNLPNYMSLPYSFVGEAKDHRASGLRECHPTEKDPDHQ